MNNWRTFKPTVSPESWKRIEQYIEDAQDECTLEDYPGISSWHEMALVLCLHEKGMANEAKFNDLIEDYKKYLETLK